MFLICGKLARKENAVVEGCLRTGCLVKERRSNRVMSRGVGYWLRECGEELRVKDGRGDETRRGRGRGTRLTSWGREEATSYEASYLRAMLIIRSNVVMRQWRQSRTGTIITAQSRIGIFGNEMADGLARANREGRGVGYLVVSYVRDSLSYGHSGVSSQN